MTHILSPYRGSQCILQLLNKRIQFIIHTLLKDRDKNVLFSVFCINHSVRHKINIQVLKSIQLQIKAILWQWHLIHYAKKNFNLNKMASEKVKVCHWQECRLTHKGLILPSAVWSLETSIWLFHLKCNGTNWPKNTSVASNDFNFILHENLVHCFYKTNLNLIVFQKLILFLKSQHSSLPSHPLGKQVNEMHCPRSRINSIWTNAAHCIREKQANP